MIADFREGCLHYHALIDGLFPANEHVNETLKRQITRVCPDRPRPEPAKILLTDLQNRIAQNGRVWFDAQARRIAGGHPPVDTFRRPFCEFDCAV